VTNVNRHPSGILELLDLNLQGEYPRELASQISTSIEALQFYFQGIPSQATLNTGTILAVNTGVGLTVPEGETWALRSVGFRAENLDTNATFNGAWRILIPVAGGVSAGVLVSGTLSTIFTNQFFELGATWDNPLLIRPGWTVQFICNSIGGIPVNGFVYASSLIYHRLTLG